MEYKYYIYITTNLINQKKYIGKRKCTCDVKQDTYIGSGKILRSAIKKYGKENFIKNILEVCETEEICNEREKYWIAFYNAPYSDEFYNIALGGEGGNTYAGLNAEELKRISQIKSNKSSGENNPRYKAVVTAETRDRISQGVKDHYLKTGRSSTSGKFGKENKLSIPIFCIELNQIFYGIREASRVLNIPQPNIIRSLKSSGKYSAGKIDGNKLHWIYMEEKR
jgi:group I intron endonuclease